MPVWYSLIHHLLQGVQLTLIIKTLLITGFNMKNLKKKSTTQKATCKQLAETQGF